MSYIVLARKYRPQNFSEVYAQDHVTKILQSAIKSERIAHAYLFTGPRGVGKTSLARIMAKSLNCETGPTTQPCNECTNCVEITSGVSPDVIEIDGASNTGVDDIRELQRELLYAASGAKFKIYIIDEVHMLSKNAFNALLKTLEEPPENVIFIFATTEPHKVIATIVSRCQRYDFKRIPVDSIVERLRDLCVKEKITIDEESLYLIARKADGGMRDALSLMDQTISYCQDSINIEQVRQIFGMIPNQIYHDFMQMIKNHETKALISELHKIFEEGTDLQEFIANMLEYLRIVLLTKLDVQIRDVSQDEMPMFSEIGGLFAQNDLLYIMSQLMQTKIDIRQSSNPHLLIEALMIRLSRLDEISEISELISFLKTNPSPSAPAVVKTAPKPAKQTERPVLKPQPEPGLSKVELSLQNLNDHWDTLSTRIKKSSKTAGLAFQNAKLVELKEHAMTIKTASKTEYGMLKTNKERIEGIIKDFFGKALHLNLELIEQDAPTKVDIQRKTIDDLKKDNPEIEGFIEQTQARLI
jgi:DNA polymerase-3 subunit gamma/tau